MKKIACIILSVILCCGAFLVSGCGLIEQEQTDDELREEIENLIENEVDLDAGSDYTGTLKILFDRLVYGLMGESPRGIPVPLLRGKRAMIISTCTTPFPFNIWFHQSHGTIRAVREILKWSGFRIVSTYERGGTRMQPLTEKDLERCRKRARKLF